ncbi:MAG: hypothetical protein Q8L14_30355 [Myxococcales bacterium]|nr:hypothetical protein [Myxococcales bacterium]
MNRAILPSALPTLRPPALLEVRRAATVAPAPSASRPLPLPTDTFVAPAVRPSTDLAANLPLDVEDAAWRQLTRSPSTFVQLGFPANGREALVAYAVSRSPHYAAYAHVGVWERPGFASTLLARHPQMFQYLPEPVRARPELARLALEGGMPASLIPLAAFEADASLATFSLEKDAVNLTDLPESLRTDPALVALARTQLLEHGSQTPYVLGYLPELAGDKALVVARLRVAPSELGYVEPALLEDPDVQASLREALLANPPLLLPGTALWLLPEAMREDPALERVIAQFGGIAALTERQLSRPELVALAAVATAGYYEQLAAPWSSNLHLAKAFLEHTTVQHDEDDKPVGPVLISRIPEALRADPQLAVAAIIRDPRSFVELPATLRDDPTVASVALALDGLLVAHAGPTVLANERCIINALRSQPTAITLLPPELQVSPELWERVLRVADTLAPHVPAQVPNRVALIARHAPRSLTLADAVAAAPGWATRPDDVARLVAHFGPDQVLGQVSPALLADPAVARRLVEVHGASFEFLPAALQADEAIARAAANDPRAYGTWGSKLPQRREWVVGALERDPALFPQLSPSLRADRQVAFTAVALDATQLAKVELPLRDEPTFLIEAAKVNPLVLFELGPTHRASLLGQDAGLAASWQALEKDLSGLGIHSLERFHGKGALLEQILVNRRAGPEDTRPIAVIVSSSEDWNGGIAAGNTIEQLTQHYRVMYYEADSEGHVVQALRNATRFQKAEVLVVAAHGSQGVAAFGASDPRLSGQDGPSAATLDLNDQNLFALHGLRERLAPEGHVVMMSCSTGHGRNAGDNIANLMVRMFPQANVWAPTEPTNVDFRLDAQGRFRHPGFAYSDGVGGITYHVPPRTSG